jgi:hypothetical protein
LLPVVSLAGLFGAASAQEQPWYEPLKWDEIDKPSINGEIVIAPSEINHIAASHDIVYALDSVTNVTGRLSRSNNGGLTFTDITSSLQRANVALPCWQIAVAPDSPFYVAVVANDHRSVYYSDDSGATWYGTGSIPNPTAGEEIQCITISSSYVLTGATLLHDIAIGTAVWGSAKGRVLTFQIGSAFSNWIDQLLTVGTSTTADVSAVAFSPRYSADLTILAVASDGPIADPPNGNTYLCIGTRDQSSQTTTWNGNAGYTDYPMRITKEGDPGVGNSILSSISLPSNYSGSNQATRLAFVGFNRSPDATVENDAYRINDALSPQVQRLNVAGGTSIDISSIAYHGTLVSGKMLAGLTDLDPTAPDISQVRWTVNPLGSPIGTPNSTVWHIPNQNPTGPGNAQVAWSQSGAVGFCGTGQNSITNYDESAFSQSLDNGNNWQQTSLINTNLFLSDIAPSPDSLSLFMATYSEFGAESVWRSAGEPLGRYWGRLLTVPTATNRVILRLSPNYTTDYTLYAIEVDNSTSVNFPILPLPPPPPNNSQSFNRLEISLNRGNTWKEICIPRPVIDVVTAGQYTLYLATTGGYIRKSTDGGISWGDKVATDLDNINMLAVSDNGHVFAGSRDGWVAYSTDEGVSYTKIQKPVSLLMSDVQVVPDANYSANNIIYASGRTGDATAAGVWRWTIGQSTEWEQIDSSIAEVVTGEQISGLKTGPEGTLYALRADNVTRSNGMNRTLDPLYPFPEQVEWNLIYRTLPVNAPLNIPPIAIAFDPAPLNFAGNVPWLKLTGDSSENDLWAIDTSNGLNDNTTAIYRFRDNVCKVGPWIKGPSEVGCDPVTGRNQQVDLSWEQLSLSDRYDLQLAKDPDFTLRINPAISNSDNISAVTGSIHIKTDPVSVTSPALWLPPASLPEAGADYYWRIRTYHAATGEFIWSPWSDTDNFIVKPGFPVATPYYGPQLLSPADGCACAYNAPVSFSWTPYKEITAYKFELSERSDMSRPLISTTVSSAAYLYTGQLKNNTAYFWRVTAAEPVPGESSATFSFYTAPASAAAPAYLIPRSQPIPLWAVIGFAISVLAIIILLVLIFRRWGVFP